MQCTACKGFDSIEAGFCRNCGVEQPWSRLPVKAEPVASPVRWEQAAPALARGAALVAAGLAAEWLLRYAARYARSSGKAPGRGKKALVAGKARPLSADALTVTETVILQRRTVTRR